MDVAGKGVTGLFYGDSKQFIAECLAGFSCITWNVVAAGIIFFVIGKVLGSNRVPPEVEIAGLDIPEMGAPGYPEYITSMAPENVPSSEISAARTQIKQLASV
jgi:Amt family ammonium transporter